MKLTVEEKKQRNRKMVTSSIATILVCLFLLSCFFFPLLTVKEENRPYLEENPDGHNAFGEVLTNKQGINISMMEFFRLYWDAYAEGDTAEAITAVVIFCGAAIFALFMILFAWTRKPVMVIVLDAIALLLHLLAVDYITSRNFLDLYDWGYATHLYYIGFTAVFVCAVWMLVTKIRVVRKLKNERLESAGEITLAEHE